MNASGDPSTAIAIIPARGGSKRLPRKNILELDGIPMLAHSIRAAIASGCFAEVIVSTEDAEIADVARRFDASVDERAASLARDSSTVVEVCLDLLDRMDRAQRLPDRFCCLYATAPLRNADDVRAVVDLLEPGVCDFATAVASFNLAAHQALKIDADGNLQAMWPELIELRADALPRLVGNNGSTYAANVSAFREQQTFFGKKLKGYEMPMHRSIDIDTEEELEFLRRVVSAQRNN